MSVPTLLLERIRLEKAAQDAGFDLSVQVQDNWLLFRSTAFPQVVGVLPCAESAYCLGLSDPSIGEQIACEFELQATGSIPPWSIYLEGIPDYQTLYSLMDRMAEMYRVVAGAGIKHFHERTHTPPDATEVSRLVRQRIGQDVFRATLLEYWGRRCALSGLDEPQLLRASHIKPWARCDTDEERLDVFNGLLLAPHFDALFDAGWITFQNSGIIQISPALHPRHRQALGVYGTETLRALASAHLPYLAWHRKNWFRLS